MMASLMLEVLTRERLNTKWCFEKSNAICLIQIKNTFTKNRAPIMEQAAAVSG